MPHAPDDPPRRSARLRLELLEPPAPPAPPPGGDPMDDQVGMLVLVLWKIAGTEIRTETFESPPLKRRYLPWVKDLFRRIAQDQVDRLPPEKIAASLERTARLPAKPEGER